MTTLSQGHPTVAPSALTVVSRRFDALRLNPRSPRLHSTRQIKQIARSIETFGFNVPVLVDGSNQVVAGHGRVLACRALGWAEVPTIRLDHLSDAQVQAFMITDNRLSELSDWDDHLLAETLRDLSVLNLDFSIEVTGFDMGAIDLCIESLETPPKAAAADPADAVPELVSGPAVSAMGNVWAARPSPARMRQRARAGELRCT